MGVPTDWDVVIREDRGEPIRFVLGGTEFSVPSPLRGAAFLDYANSEQKGADAVFAMILDWLDPDGDEPKVRDEFLAAYRRSKGSLKVLERIAMSIMEEDSARPTTLPSDSLPSPPRIGAPTSNGASPSRVGSRRQRIRSG